jgi:hypothetical protein
MAVGRSTAVVISLALSCGCAQFTGSTAGACAPDGPAFARTKTLLAWSAGREEPAGEKANGNEAGGAPGAAESLEPAEEPLASDRPDFTEASSTVGKGRIQLEAGYTFVRDRSFGVTRTSHSYPEALLRIGAVTDWLEFRVGQNLGHFQTGTPLGGTLRTNGAEDLYLGVKLGLTEQKRLLPEVALVLQTTVPTGHDEFTSGKMEPGFNLLYGWDVVPDLVTFAGSTQANRVYDEARHGYVELAQSLTVGYTLTDRLGAYTEWFAFFPTGAVAPGVTAQHYANGGFTFRVTPNFQLDVRAGLGLSSSADDFFAGTGFAVRY